MYSLSILKFLYFLIENDLGLLVDFLSHLLFQVLLLLDTLFLSLNMHFELFIVPVT